METLDEVLRRNAARIRADVGRRRSGERVLTHVPTGFEQLDRQFGGVRIGTATELLAHTGDGKSAFLRQLAEGAAKAGAGVLWICGEDPEDATAERQFAGDTGIPTTDLGRLDLTDAELDNVDRAARLAAGWAERVAVVFGAPDVDEVLAIVDSVEAVGCAQVNEVLLDYAQIFSEARNLEDDVARLGKALNQRAAGRRMATVVASQVSNDVLKRGRERWEAQHDISGIRPSIGDTEWCKRLEKSTKQVWSLYRPGRWMREYGEDVPDDHAELHVIKANFGGMGWTRLNWDGPSCRFS